MTGVARASVGPTVTPFAHTTQPWFLGRIGEPSPGARFAQLPILRFERHDIWISEHWRRDSAGPCARADGGTVHLSFPLVEFKIWRPGASGRAWPRLSGGGFVRLAREVPSGTLIGHGDGVTFVSASFPGVSAVHWWRESDSTYWYSSSALILRALAGARIDGRYIAVILAAAEVPDLAEPPQPFVGIHRVPAGHYIRIEGPSLLVGRYWTPPDPTVEFREATTLVRDALSGAVSHQLDSHESASVDLSGGFDSGICATLASEASGAPGRRIPALTYGTRSSSFADWQYAADIVREHPSLEWRFIELKDLPSVFEGVTAPLPLVTDRPSAMLVGTGRLRRIFELVAGFGSSIHLTGHGADALADWSWVRKADIARSQPPRAMRDAKVAYAAWIRGAVEGLGPRGQAMHWGPRAEIPPWMTRRAIDCVVGWIEKRCRTAEPWSIEPRQHRVAGAVVAAASACDVIGVFAGAAGVTLVHPFLDSRVIQMFLSVTPAAMERGGFKPLLAQAFEDTLPPRFFSRTKESSGSYFTDDVLLGLRRNLAKLSAMVTDPVLGQLGLVNVDLLRTGLADLATSRNRGLAGILDVLAVETWLRGVAATSPAAI